MGGVPREEVAAAVAAESSTGTWSTVWSELLTDLEFYKGRCYRIEDVPGDPEAFYAFIAYPLDLFEEGSITNVLTSLVGNVFGFKALRHLRLEDIRFPIAFIKTCGGPPNGIVVERDRLNKYGRPLLGCTANTGLANWCRKNGMLLHIHRAMHAVIDRHPKHGIHFRVLAKCLRLSGGDQLHTGTVVGKLEGDRQTTLGYIDNLRESFVPEDRSRGNFFDQDWGSMPGVFAVASGGIHVWHMPALLAIFGDDSCLQFGGGTHGHPWGSAAGAAANRVALEACVKARNAGREIEKESRDILMEAAKHSPELAIALETWKEIKFEFDTVDKLDVQG